jgi:hypothetical protein
MGLSSGVVYTPDPTKTSGLEIPVEQVAAEEQL